MTHRSRFAALLLPFALGASIPVASHSTPRVEQPEQLPALLATYETSLNAGDVGRIEQLYPEDGVWQVGGPRRVRRGCGEDPYRDPLHPVDELTVNGDVAYARTHSAGTATVVATGPSGPEANRELFIVAGGPGGWKIARYMFNIES